MSEPTQPHAEPQDGELKPHGDELEGALKPTQKSQIDSQQQNAVNSGKESKE